MTPLSIPDLEALQGQTSLYRVLLAVRNAINTLLGDLQAGTATLAAGTASVRFGGLTASSKILVSRTTIGGTAGNLYVDPASYDVANRTFVISSSSATDTSGVVWLHWR